MVGVRGTPSLISEVSGSRLQPGHRWYPFRQVTSPGNELLHNVFETSPAGKTSLNIAVCPGDPTESLLTIAKQIHDGLSRVGGGAWRVRSRGRGTQTRSSAQVSRAVALSWMCQLFIAVTKYQDGISEVSNVQVSLATLQWACWGRTSWKGVAEHPESSRGGSQDKLGSPRTCPHFLQPCPLSSMSTLPDPFCYKPVNARIH